MDLEKQDPPTYHVGSATSRVRFYHTPIKPTHSAPNTNLSHQDTSEYTNKYTKMSTIAVAGGTGGIGKTIVEALLQEPKYRVIVLTQSVRPLIDDASRALTHETQIPKEDPILKQTQQIQINYNDLDSIVETLEKHAVHTVISAIGIYTDEAAQSQMNLVQAAEKSSVTKRFVPSEYSFIQTEEYVYPAWH